MDFRPLSETERKQLVDALRGNADEGRALLIDRRDTSFTGTAEDIPDEEVISAITSVPCHYLVTDGTHLVGIVGLKDLLSFLNEKIELEGAKR